MILIKKYFFIRTIRGNMEKRREERELDAEERNAGTISNNLRQLPVREKLLARNEIRNTLFKYQMDVFNQHDLVGNVLLGNVAQCSDYTELLEYISLAMTYINQYQTAWEKLSKSLTRLLSPFIYFFCITSC